MLRIPPALLFALLLAASLPVHAAGPTGLLNDTGQDTCDDGAYNLVACSALNSDDAATFPRQDGRFGRDAAAVASALSKTGAGVAGSDFTKVCFNGDLEGSGICTGALVANTSATATGTPGTDWACSRDNVTNLIWSLQIGYGNWTTYATSTYPAAMNSTSRCGYNSGWRLPTLLELLSIVNNGTFFAAIDRAYFPGTVSDVYWSADTYAPIPASYAWAVDFGDGHHGAVGKYFGYYVRLVRSGQ